MSKLVYEWFDDLEVEANLTLGWRLVESLPGIPMAVLGKTLMRNGDFVPAAMESFCRIGEMAVARAISEGAFDLPLSERGFGT